MDAIISIFEALTSLITSVLAAFVGLFVEGAASLGAIELLLVLVVLIVEVLYLITLNLLALVKSLFKLEAPKFVKKPVLWRPAKLGKTK
ncbi:MAG: hypothetical protein ACPG4U_11135 [Pseudomonadales bacterium]